MAENSYHLREMIEQCSRCSLPTGSGTSDQKSENVKSCVTPMPTNDPIFVMIRFIKTPLHYENLRTCSIPLQYWKCKIPQHFSNGIQNTGNSIWWQKIAITSGKWLNSAPAACCQRAQEPRIKNPKTSNRVYRRCQPTIRFWSWSVSLKHHFIMKNYELVVSLCNTENARFLSIFQTASKIRETAFNGRK